MGIPYWDDDPETWDLLVLGTDTLPGPFDVEDGNGKRVFDIKKGPGRDGAIIKDMGYQPGAMTFVGQIVGREAWERMQEIVIGLRATQKEGKGAQQPVNVSHPKTLMMNIKQVLISGVDFPSLDNGIMTVRIHAVEYVKPKKQRAKKQQQFILEEEVRRRERAQEAPMTDEQAKNISQANAEYEASLQSGGIPNFSRVPPQYTPAP